MKTKLWLVYALITTIFWGVWGALIEIPEKAGFPATLAYAVWALTMIIPAFVVMNMIKWKLEVSKKAIFYGLIIGFLGAGGQLILFHALVTGPAYLVFPFISLSPLVTILLSYTLLKERANRKGWIGIIMAVIAIPMLSYQTPDSSAQFGYFWIILAMTVLFAWGIQAFFMKIANNHMKAESIFFYMMLTGLILIPVALYMTDFSADINWGFTGPYLTAGIQILNAVGALMLVYAFRYGKAIIVSPLTNAGAPVITIIISLSIYAVVPHLIILTGMILAIIAVLLMAQAEA
jgi:drug/metabolite transporter (DMT)-like permease